MKLENLEVFNFKGAFRGMRNPMNSWEKSDSIFEILNADDADDFYYEVAYNWTEQERKAGNQEIIEKYMNWLNNVGHLRWADYTSYIQDIALLGPKDLQLAQRLIRAGGEHRKFLRQIIVSFDLTAPLYFFKEFDTYKVGTVANSTSTMHKLATTPITLDCFETDDFQDFPFGLDHETWSMKNSDHVKCIIRYLEDLRLKYLETNDKKYWKELIRWLPESWLQTRTITMNYENILSIIHQRHNHKLSEWNWLIDQFKKQLPYAYELLFFTLEEN